VIARRRAQLVRWRAEQQARLAVRVANRTFRRHPNGLDRLAHRILAKAVGLGGLSPADRAELEHPA
jgi:hypothetical protein